MRQCRARGLNALLLGSILLSSGRLGVQAGDAQRVGEEARQAQRQSLEARVTLVRSLTSGNSSRAKTEIARLLREAPDVAIVHA